jgi:hypothetical protein
VRVQTIIMNDVFLKNTYIIFPRMRIVLDTFHEIMTEIIEVEQLANSLYIIVLYYNISGYTTFVVTV